ncbi:hypothetical protein SCLARK_001782 [Spiroplasma clarkii]|nr:hypothetical protein SCLARK_001782 [Spiroplasma clarkii]
MNWGSSQKVKIWLRLFRDAKSPSAPHNTDKPIKIARNMITTNQFQKFLMLFTKECLKIVISNMDSLFFIVNCSSISKLIVYFITKK